MLYFVSGKPGASKTLHAISRVEEMRADARKAGRERPVFYWNIGDVTLAGWQPMGDESTFDRRADGIEPDRSVAERWFELPADSIIVLDECQILWRKRPQGSEVPPYVSQLEVHRKKGFDVVAISQDPTLVDTHARKLVGLHTHYRRIFGTETYHSFEWMEKCITDPESSAEQSKALEKRGRFPKQFYGTYRSAQVHNVKARPPYKWIVMVAVALVGFPVLVWTGYTLLRGKLSPPEPALTSKEVDAKLQASERRIVTHVKAMIEANPWDPKLHTTRVAGVEGSQPFFDQLVRPVSFPRVRGCMQLVIDGKLDCRCQSQQGTELDMTQRQCVKAIRRGVFDFTKADPKEEEKRPPDVASPDPAAALSSGESASRAE